MSAQPDDAPTGCTLQPEVIEEQSATKFSAEAEIRAFSHVKPRPSVQALDLEATLFSNAVSQFQRPLLFEFLERCTELFTRIVMFTTVREKPFRQIARTLVEEGTVPSWFAELECINWTGKIKDLALIPGCVAEEAILVDDLAAYVHPVQRAQWVMVDPFELPFDDNDAGLPKVLKEREPRVRRDSVKGALP